MTFKPRPITLDPSPVLRQKAQPVPFPLSEEHQELIEYMINHVRVSQDEEQNKIHDLQGAVGIAAPQLGYPLRMFVMRASDDNGHLQEYALINPRLLGTSIQKAYLKGGEGCLSVPEVHEGYVIRYAQALIKGFDYIRNKDVQLRLKGYPAIVAQHEYDHIEGILYYDRINKTDAFQEVVGALVIE